MKLVGGRVSLIPLLPHCILSVAQRTYQCNIQIDQTGDPMRITVAGQPGTIDAAASAVTEIINGGNPFGMGGPASLGGAFGCRVLSCTVS